MEGVFYLFLDELAFVDDFYLKHELLIYGVLFSTLKNADCIPCNNTVILFGPWFWFHPSKFRENILKTHKPCIEYINTLMWCTMDDCLNVYLLERHGYVIAFYVCLYQTFYIRPTHIYRETILWEISYSFLICFYMLCLLNDFL